MKKIVSLTIIFAMLLSVLVLAVSAAVPATAPKPWEYGISGQKTLNLYYAKTAPKIDGTISNGEYPGPNNGLANNATVGDGLWITTDQINVSTSHPAAIEPKYAKTYAAYDDNFIYFAVEVNEKKHESQNYQLDLRIGLSQSEILYEAYSSLWVKFNIDKTTYANSVTIPNKHRRCYTVNADDHTVYTADYPPAYVDSTGTVWNQEQYSKYFVGTVTDGADGNVTVVYEFAIPIGDAIGIKASYEPDYKSIVENGSFRGYFYFYTYVDVSKTYAQNSVPRGNPFDPSDATVSILQALGDWKEKAPMYIPNVLTFNGLYGQPGVRTTTTPLANSAPASTAAPVTTQAASTTKAATSASTTAAAATTQAASTTKATTSTSTTAAATTKSATPSTTKAALENTEGGLPVGAIIAIIVAVLAIAGGVTYFILKKKNIIK